jgi:hypothetical protein
MPDQIQKYAAEIEGRETPPPRNPKRGAITLSPAYFRYQNALNLVRISSILPKIQEKVYIEIVFQD